MAFGLGLLISLFAVPSILSAYHDDTPLADAGPIYEPGPPKDIIREIPPPVLPSLTPPPPTRTTIAFVPPIVSKDEVVQDENQKSIPDILDTSGDIGTKDVKGNNETPPSLQETPALNSVLEVPQVAEKTHDMFDIQKDPSLPGGLQEMYKWLNNNVIYPEMAKTSGVSGQVVLSFVVGKDGIIRDICIVKDIGGGCGKSVQTTLAKMPPWSPGEANGHPVKVRYTLPFKFTLH